MKNTKKFKLFTTGFVVILGISITVGSFTHIKQASALNNQVEFLKEY